MLNLAIPASLLERLGLTAAHCTRAWSCLGLIERMFFVNDLFPCGWLAFGPQGIHFHATGKKSSAAVGGLAAVGVHYSDRSLA